MQQHIAYTFHSFVSPSTMPNATSLRHAKEIKNAALDSREVDMLSSSSALSYFVSHPNVNPFYGVAT